MINIGLFIKRYSSSMAAGDTAEDSQNKPIFRDLTAEDEEQEVTEIESLCMNCHEQGITKLMLTRIPFFKEVIIQSFCCDSCGYTDKGIQAAGSLQEKGVKYALTVKNSADLDRQVVKSEWCTFSIPSVEFEQPPTSTSGQVNTIEGLIDGVVNGIELHQEARRQIEPETAAALDAFVEKLKKLKTLEEPFEIVITDPSGNSFVENPEAPKKDTNLTIEKFTRTKEQEIKMGFAAEEPDVDATEEKDKETKEKTVEELADELKGEVLTFPANCPNCSVACVTNMKLVDIPFFKQVIIMATVCDACGLKENEVKGATGIEDKGKRITLKLTDVSDLNRDILKSDTCGLRIPELDFELTEGSLGGKFTTVEGILTNIKDQLFKDNPFVQGDSTQDGPRQKLDEFCQKLDKIIKGEMLDVTIILDDPAGNSYVQNVYAPDDDPEMTIEEYTRNEDQNDTLGLTHMKTENYEEES